MVDPIIDVFSHDSIFKLNDSFLEEYKEKEVPWGFGDFSWVTFKRTYARKLRKSILFPDRPDSHDVGTEEWWQACQRVVEGTITIQKTHCSSMGLPWDDNKARRMAQEMYDRMFYFKWTPPGRGIWTMGTDFVFERTGACLNNCGFVSSKDISTDFAKPFGWAFEMSMLGVGVGFDTRGAGAVTIQEPEKSDEVHVVDDSREGWREAIERVLYSFVGEAELPKEFDYSEVREKGELIKSFGGVASGPAPLEKAINKLIEIYHRYVGKEVDSKLITDTFNISGKCVVAGGVRRSAQIALGSPNDEQFLSLKNGSDFPERNDDIDGWSWVSNNSPICEVGQDYSGIAEKVQRDGEPGVQWLENAQKFGRLKDPANWKDKRVIGVNPCGEQSLESWELCCLVETFPVNHDGVDDFKRTLKAAYQYAKTVTLVPTHSERTNSVMMRNRRIGCSITGIVQSVNKHGYREFFDWCDEGYDYIQHLDRKYSDWLCVPNSVKTTSVKPSGTVSILAGSTAGVHWPKAVHYLKRMRISDTQEDLLQSLKDSGYPMEPAVTEDDAVVVEIPVKIDDCNRGRKDVSIWEKAELAAKMQYYWSDNQVSLTVEFLPEEEGGQIERLLEAYEDRLKGISFLPIRDLKEEYKQVPEEFITEEEYLERVSNLSDIERVSVDRDREDKFCDGESCKIEL